MVAFLLGVAGHTCGSRSTVNFLNGFVGRNETANQRLFFIDVVQFHYDIYIIGGVRNRSGFRPTKLNHARMAKSATEADSALPRPSMAD